MTQFDQGMYSPRYHIYRTKWSEKFEDDIYDTKDFCITQVAVDTDLPNKAPYESGRYRFS